MIPISLRSKSKISRRFQPHTIILQFYCRKLQQYILDFVDKPCEIYENTKIGDDFNKPKSELIEHLQKKILMFTL